MLFVMTRHTSPIARKAATARRVRIRCRSGDAAKRIAASERSSNGARAPDSNSSVSRAACSDVQSARYHLPETRPCFSKTIHEILAEFRWCREGAPGLVWRPGPRPAPLGRPGHISGVPSRPKHPAQPLALDVGSPRAALVAGKGYFFASVRGSPHPTGPACSHDPCASKTISARLPPARFANGRGGRPVARRRAARPTRPPMARSCGARRRLPSCGSKYQCPPALQGAPSLHI